jgi:endonuclease YncB( thermonuclease family)
MAKAKTAKKSAKTTVKGPSVKVTAHKAGRAAQDKVGKGNVGYTEAYKTAYNEVLVAAGLAPKYTPKVETPAASEEAAA